MRNGKICARCGVELDTENTNPSTFKRKDGICRECAKKNWHLYKKAHPERILASNVSYKSSLLGRHTTLRRALKREAAPLSDLLWSTNYYAELIRDLTCHYCRLSIKTGGHSLDRIDNSKAHVCYNVVQCCWDCNELKSSRFSHDEMMKIAVVLKEIKSFRNTNL